jgi:hypothetical protein
MSDDELLKELRGEPPAEVMNDSLFWARVSRDVSAGIAKRRSRSSLRLGSVAAVAALLAVVIFARMPRHVAHDEPFTVEAPEAPESSAGVAIEDLTDDELDRAMHTFPKAQGG